MAVRIRNCNQSGEFNPLIRIFLVYLLEIVLRVLIVFRKINFTSKLRFQLFFQRRLENYVSIDKMVWYKLLRTKSIIMEKRKYSFIDLLMILDDSFLSSKSNNMCVCVYIYIRITRFVYHKILLCSLTQLYARQACAAGFFSRVTWQIKRK